MAIRTKVIMALMTASVFAGTLPAASVMAAETAQVQEAELADLDVTLANASYNYNGTSQKAEVTSVKYKDMTLSSSQYKVSYSADTTGNESNDTTVIVTVRVNGGVTDSDGNDISAATGTSAYIIYKDKAEKPAPSTKKTFTIAGLTAQTYTGAEITPKFQVLSPDSVILSENTDYIVEYDYNVIVGDGTVIITGLGDYKGYFATATFPIGKADISKATLSNLPTDAVYKIGGNTAPNLKVKMNGNTLTSGTDYTVRYENNTSVGTARIIIEGIGNYSGEISDTFEIKAKSLGDSDISISSFDSELYTGHSIKPKVNVKDGATKLTKGTDFTVKYGDNVGEEDEDSTGEVIIKGKGNYTGEITDSFTIKKIKEKEDSSKQQTQQTTSVSQEVANNQQPVSANMAVLPQIQEPKNIVSTEVEQKYAQKNLAGPNTTSTNKARKKSPQTGDATTVPYQTAGASFMMAGIAGLYFNYNDKKKKEKKE